MCFSGVILCFAYVSNTKPPTPLSLSHYFYYFFFQSHHICLIKVRLGKGYIRPTTLLVLNSLTSNTWDYTSSHWLVLFEIKIIMSKQCQS